MRSAAGLPYGARGMNCDAPSDRTLTGAAVRLVVEFEPGEPVSGSMCREGQASTPFVGMIDFLALLERLRCGEPGEAVGP